MRSQVHLWALFLVLSLRAAALAGPCVSGDADGDMAVDLQDFALFQSCYGGTSGESLDEACAELDLDHDGHVGLADFRNLAVLLKGPAASPPLIVIERAPNVTADTTVTISGQALSACSVRIWGGETPVEVPVVEGRFDAEVGLAPNTMSHLTVVGLAGNQVSGMPSHLSISQQAATQSLTEVRGYFYAGSLGDSWVRIVGQPSRVAGIGEDGSFLIPDVSVDSGPLTVVATYTYAGAYDLGAVAGVVPVPGGVTDIGLIPRDDAVAIWNRSSNGDWETTSNWFDDRMPGPGMATIIETPHTVSLSSDISVKDLTLASSDAKVVITGATASVADHLTIHSGQLVLQDATVVAGDELWTEGEILARGTSEIRGPLSQKGTLRAEGTVAYGEAVLTIARGFANDGSIFLTSTGAVVDAQLHVGTFGIYNRSTGVITLDYGTGGLRLVASPFDNSGTVLVNTDAIWNAPEGAHENIGTLSVLSTGRLSLDLGGGGSLFETSGAIHVFANGVLELNGGAASLNSPGMVEADGEFRTDRVDTTLTGGRLVVPGTLFVANGDFTTLGGSLEVSGDFTVEDGSAEFAGGSILEPWHVLLVRSQLTTGIASVLEGTIWAHGACRLVGDVTSTMIARIQGTQESGDASLGMDPGARNSGTIVLETLYAPWSTTLDVPSGTVTNLAAGLIDVNPNGGGRSTIRGGFDNQGLLDLHGGQVRIVPGVGTQRFANAGEVHAAVGTELTLGIGESVSLDNGRLVAAGAVNVSGGDFTIAGGAVDLHGPFHVEYGRVDLAGGSLVMTDAFSVYSSEFELRGGTWSTGGTFDIRDSLLNLETGTVHGTWSAVLQDSRLVLDAGAESARNIVMRGASSFEGDVLPDMWIRVEGADRSGDAILRVEGPTRNFGRITLESSTGAWASNLIVEGGALTNDAVGVIEVHRGSGGTRLIDAEIVNDGIIITTTDMSLRPSGSGLTNYGEVVTHLGSFMVKNDVGTATYANYGRVAVESGGVLHVIATHLTNHETGEFRVAGVFEAAEGSSVVTSGNVSAPGALLFTDSDFTVRSGIALLDGTVFLHNTTLDFAGGVATFAETPYVVDSTVRFTGGIAAGEWSPYFVDSRLELDVEPPAFASVAMYGSCSLRGVIPSGMNVFVLADSLHGDATLLIDEGVVNRGSITLDPMAAPRRASLVIPRGSLTNDSNGIITLNPRGSGASSIYGKLTNAGWVEFLGGNVSVTPGLDAAGFDNVGDLYVGAATSFWLNSGGLTNRVGGLVTVDGLMTMTSSVLEGDGGSFVVNGAIDVENGSIRLPDGYMEITGSLSVENGRFTLDGGTLACPGAFWARNSIINLESGVLDGPWSPTLVDSNLTLADVAPVEGTILIHGSCSLTGDVAQGAVVAVQGSGNAGDALLTLSGSCKNAGVIILEAIDGPWRSELHSSDGMLTNEVGGEVVIARGSGGARLIDAAILNLGLLDIEANTTIRSHGITNHGDILVGAAWVDIEETDSSGELFNSGGIHVPVGSVLTISGGPFVQDLGRITGRGILRLANASLEGSGTISPDLIALAGGGISPGVGLSTTSTAAISMAGDYVQRFGAILTLDIGGTVPELQFEQLHVDQAISLAGTLMIRFESGYVPQPGDTYELMTFGKRIGMFDAVETVNAPPDLAFELSATQSAITMTAVER